MEDSFLDRKRLEPKELLWKQHYGRHFVSFVMDIYGAKFQEHCFNISRDIVFSAFYNLYLQTIWRHHWSNLHNRKTLISLKRKKVFQKEKRHSSVFWKAFQVSRNCFSLHMHFKVAIIIPSFRALPYERLALWPSECRLDLSGNPSNKQVIINKLVVIKD